MRYQEGSFNSWDNLRLYEQSWIPDITVKAAIIIIHGSLEHSGRYARVASYFVQQGYSVYSFDLRGHGKSDGERAFIPSFGALIKDIGVFLNRVKQKDPDRQIFLFGHSLGGSLIVLSDINQKLSDIKGVILSSPVLKMGQGVSAIARNIAVMAGYLFPRLKLRKMDANFLSRDPEVITTYNNDPLVYKEGIFARSLSEFIRTIKDIQGKMEKVKIPMVILHGTSDRLSNVEGSKELYNRAQSQDKTIKLYDNFYHELMNEPEKEKVLADAVSWLNARSFNGQS